MKKRGVGSKPRWSFLSGSMEILIKYINEREMGGLYYTGRSLLGVASASATLRGIWRHLVLKVIGRVVFHK